MAEIRRGGFRIESIARAFLKVNPSAKGFSVQGFLLFEKTLQLPLANHSQIEYSISQLRIIIN